MTRWEKEQAKLKTEKAKRWQYLCGRKDFNNLKQISKDTYMCSLHFVDNKGPTDENPEPILATLTENEIKSRQSRKRKTPKQKTPEYLPTDPKRVCNKDLTLENKSNHESEPILEPEAELIVDSTPEPTVTSDTVSNSKETQTVYDKYVLGAKIETIVLKNQTSLHAEGTDKKYTHNLDLINILKDREKTKFFTGLFPEQFDALFNFLGPAKYKLKY